MFIIKARATYIDHFVFDIKESYMEEKADTGKSRNEANEKLEKALLMAFDPYTNAEVMELLKQQENIEDLSREMLKSYYKLRLCVY